MKLMTISWLNLTESKSAFKIMQAQIYQIINQRCRHFQHHSFTIIKEKPGTHFMTMILTKVVNNSQIGSLITSQWLRCLRERFLAIKSARLEDTCWHFAGRIFYPVKLFSLTEHIFPVKFWPQVKLSNLIFHIHSILHGISVERSEM